jgi:hypothetical protein
MRSLRRCAREAYLSQCTGAVPKGSSVTIFLQGVSRKKQAKDEFEDDDDEEVDYEEMVSSMMKAAGGRLLDLPSFGNREAGAPQVR